MLRRCFDSAVECLVKASGALARALHFVLVVLEGFDLHHVLRALLEPSRMLLARNRSRLHAVASMT